MENTQPVTALVPYQKNHSTLTLVAVAALTFLLGFLTATVLAVVVYILMGHATKTASNSGDRIVYLQRSGNDAATRNQRTDPANAVRPSRVPAQYETSDGVPQPPYPTGNIAQPDTFSEPVIAVPNVPSVVPDKYISRGDNSAPKPEKHSRPAPSPEFQPNSMAVPPGVSLLEQK